jgi:asparagine synthase (glutamine-hydrolysing)
MEPFIVEIRFRGQMEIKSASASARVDGVDVFWRGYLEDVAARPKRDEAQVIASAWRRFGEDFTHHINGVFAALVIDPVQATAVLAHDELALEPLFYSTTSDGLIVATQLLDIVRATGIGELDEEYISDYLAHAWHFGDRTPYSHVRRLRAGETLVWRAGKMRSVDAWTLNKVAPLRYADERDYEMRLRELLRAVVQRALGPDAICCELSGGLDSTTLFATAMEIAPHRVSACSFVYPLSTSADERPWMEAAIEKYPAPWQTFDGDALRPFSVLPDAPQAEPNQSFIYAARQNAYYAFLRARGISTVLTGEGGDATLCGSPEPFYLADLLRGFRFGKLYGAIKELATESADRRPPAYFLRRYAMSPAFAHARGRSVESQLTPSPFIDAAFALRTNIVERSQRSWAPRTSSVDTSVVLEQLIRCARLAAAFYSGDDVPARFVHPLLDRELIAFMFSVPWHVKMHPSCDRLLQRRALESILPRKILLRKNKVGPDEALYNGLAQGSGWMEWLCNHPRIVERGYVDPEAWRSALTQAQLGSTLSVRYVEAAASLEGWLRQLETLPVRSRSEPASLPTPHREKNSPSGYFA